MITPMDKLTQLQEKYDNIEAAKESIEDWARKNFIPISITSSTTIQSYNKSNLNLSTKVSRLLFFKDFKLKVIKF